MPDVGALWILATATPNLIGIYHHARSEGGARPLLAGTRGRGVLESEVAHRFERALGPNHREVAATLLKIAYVLDLDMGRPADAQPFYERALSALRGIYGDEHPLVAQAMNDIRDLRGTIART